MADLPRRGEPLIEIKKDAFGGQKFIATDTFQRYLEELDTGQGEVITIETETSFSNSFARLIVLEQRIGSGNPLTSDETGFTVDSTNLTVDMDEA